MDHNYRCRGQSHARVIELKTLVHGQYMGWPLPPPAGLLSVKLTGELL